MLPVAVGGAENHQTLWLWLAGAMLTVAAILAGIGVGLTSGTKHALWGTPELIVAYGSVAFAVLCFVAALRGARFPFARQTRRGPGGGGPFFAESVGSTTSVVSDESVGSVGSVVSDESVRTDGDGERLIAVLELEANIEDLRNRVVEGLDAIPPVYWRHLLASDVWEKHKETLGQHYSEIYKEVADAYRAANAINERVPLAMLGTTIPPDEDEQWFRAKVDGEMAHASKLLHSFAPKRRDAAQAAEPETMIRVTPLKLPILRPPSRQSHAFLALNEQKERGERLRDTGQDGEPQQYTALIRTKPPSSFAEKVEAWEHDTAAMIEVHLSAKRAIFFRNDSGLPEGGGPIGILQRRLHRLEEIIRSLPDGEPQT